jgi:hypothetical protein
LVQIDVTAVARFSSASSRADAKRSRCSSGMIAGHCRLIGKGRVLLLSLLGLMVSGCTTQSNVVNYTDEGINSATSAAANAFPTNYKSDLLDFLRSYLNDPTQVRDAAIAEPELKPLGRHTRYVACVRFTARQASGQYGPRRECAAVYIGGKFDQLIDAKGDLCATSAYKPFPELEHLIR